MFNGNTDEHRSGHHLNTTQVTSGADRATENQPAVDTNSF